MKPFDLEKALAGEPVVTRDGRQVKVAGVNHDAKTLYKIVGWLDGTTAGWCIDGKNLPYGEDPNDLFMATKTVKKEGWVHIWKNSKNTHADVFDTKDEAFAAAEYESKFGCIMSLSIQKIEWEEEI